MNYLRNAYAPPETRKTELADKCRSQEELSSADRAEIAHLLEFLVAPKVKKKRGRASTINRDMEFAVDYLEARRSGAKHKECIRQLAENHNIVSTSLWTDPEPAYSMALKRGLEALLEQMSNRCDLITSIILDDPDEEFYHRGKSAFKVAKEISSLLKERKNSNYNKSPS